MRGDAVQKPAIVADHHEAARELQQGVFECAQGFHIEVVGGLVQHQDVAAGNQGLGQMQASALTTREGANALLLIGAVEVEAPAISAAGHLELAHIEDVEPARHIFPDCFFVRQIIAVLVDKGHAHGGADLDRAAIWLLFAGNHAKQGGFARAVGADDANHGTGGHLEAQVVDQHALAKRLGDVGELDHFMAQALGHGNEDFVGLVALLVFKVGQLLKAGQAGLALGLTRLGVLARPFQLFLERPGARFFALVLQHQSLLLLLQPGAVIAFVGNAVAAVKFQNPLGGVVQKVTVVGDGHHSAGIAL